jgi:hypothetical protein
MNCRDIGRWIVAAVEHFIRSAQTSRHSATTFARNDLLFTMSDNTRMANVPWTGRFARRGFMFSDEPLGLVLGRAVCSDGLRDRRWWSQTGSNRRPPACKAGALPTELWPRASDSRTWVPSKSGMVGLGRFELPTSRLSSARSNQLSYRPMKHTLAPRSRKDGGQSMPQRPWE